MPSMGEKIRDARLQRGLTQGDLAEDLVTPSMISQIEADKTKPSYPLFTSIANRLGLPVEYFLNELQDQYTLASHLRLAEYYLLVQNPQRTIETLNSIYPPVPPGLDYQQYHLYLAKAHRLLHQYTDAVHLLEDLREQALRHQDKRLLFDVCKESGQVECDTKNIEGAIHEWRKAWQVGETLLADETYNLVETRSAVAEVCLTLHQLEYKSVKREAALSVLWNRAAELTAEHTTVRDLVAEMVRDGKRHLCLADSGKAKSLLEEAVTLLHATKRIEQSILTRATSEDAKRSVSAPPWEQAAEATTSADPHTYLEAELRQIERLLDESNVHEAQACLTRCFGVLTTFSSEYDGIDQFSGGYLHRLEVMQCRIHYVHGDRMAGRQTFEEITQKLEAEQRYDQQAYVLACWIQCEARMGDTAFCVRLAERIASSMSATSHKVISDLPLDEHAS